MSLINLSVMYGHLEGAGRDFARDPTGYLSLEAGVFKRHGLEVSWNHVQGTEERYRRLEYGSAHISLVVGRASLQHFLGSKNTRILGCAMNSCPYYLVTRPAITRLAHLEHKSLACREGTSRNTPIAETLEKLAHLRLGQDVSFQLLQGDQDAFNLLAEDKVDGALLPRPFAFIAEERGFRRLIEWPPVVDDPLPITIETTARIFQERAADLGKFLTAHQEGIRYFKSDRDQAMRILTRHFGHTESMAKKICDDYIVCMDESLKVDYPHFERLLAQVAPERAAEASAIAPEWIVPGAIKTA